MNKEDRLKDFLLRSCQKRAFCIRGLGKVRQPALENGSLKNGKVLLLVKSVEITSGYIVEQ